MNKIDLSAFCDPRDPRPYLRAPFSDGEYTCATDGRLMVRVPRIAGVNENDKITGKADRVFKMIDDFSGEFVSLAGYALPAFDGSPRTETFECDECGGSGHEHDCPDCTCECEACEGTGKFTDEITPQASVGLLGANFAIGYLTKIWGLPGLVGGVSGDSLVFKFDGGEGVLMSLRRPHEKHFGELQCEAA